MSAWPLCLSLSGSGEEAAQGSLLFANYWKEMHVYAGNT